MTQQSLKQYSTSIITPTIFTGGAMALADAMHTGAIQVSNALKFRRGAKISTIVVSDLDQRGMAFNVLFFSQNPSASTITAGATLDIADADLLNCLGHVQIASAAYTALADNALATASSLVSFSRGEVGSYNDDDRDLWVVLQSLGTSTYTTATALQLRLTFELD